MQIQKAKATVSIPIFNSKVETLLWATQTRVIWSDKTATFIGRTGWHGQNVPSPECNMNKGMGSCPECNMDKSKQGGPQ
jgi:hypothetical protein